MRKPTTLTNLHEGHAKQFATKGEINLTARDSARCAAAFSVPRLSPHVPQTRRTRHRRDLLASRRHLLFPIPIPPTLFTLSNHKSLILQV